MPKYISNPEYAARGPEKACNRSYFRSMYTASQPFPRFRAQFPCKSNPPSLSSVRLGITRLLNAQAMSILVQAAVPDFRESNLTFDNSELVFYFGSHTLLIPIQGAILVKQFSVTVALRNVTDSPVYTRTFGIQTMTGPPASIDVRLWQVAILHHASPSIDESSTLIRCKQFLQFLLHCLLNQLAGTDSKHFHQRVRTFHSTCQLHHVFLFHGGVSPMLIDLLCDNKPTRYSIFFKFSPPKQQNQLKITGRQA